MSQKCGAKTKSGAPCQCWALPGTTRCRLHGGAAAIKNKGNKHAVTHGIYAKSLSDEELALWSQIELGRIDEELKVCRIRLKRALEAEAQQRAEQLELEQYTEEPPIVGGLPLSSEDDPDIKPIIKKTFRRTDYSKIIDQLMARIESLERTRIELNKAAPPEDDVVTRIEIEVVDGTHAANPNDGTAGEVLSVDR